jgi:high-affinity iron transporter
MLSSFIIALREGLEAALIVGIVIAYVQKSNRQSMLVNVWIGVASAVALSLGLGALLSFSSTRLSEHGTALFAGITSLLAVILVTWMVFWMKRTSKNLRKDIATKVDSAFLNGPLALAGVAFLAVIREGLETSLFVYSNFMSVADPVGSTIGLIIGFSLSIAIGYAIFKATVRINLAKFFTYTGVALIVVAAGVLSYAVHEFQELGFLPGADSYVFDVTSLLGPHSLVGAVLSGSIGFDSSTSWLQAGIYALYAITVLGLYLEKSAPKAAARV